MKSTYLLLIFLSASIVAFGQKQRNYNNKKFSSRNYFFSLRDFDSIPLNGGLIIIQPSSAFWGSFRDDLSPSTIKPGADQAVKMNKLDTFPLPNSITGQAVDYLNTTYFPEMFFPSINTDSARIKLKSNFLNRIKYRDFKFVVQAMAIPLKFRAKIDTLPYTTETGANFALGAGLKWGINWYHADKNIFGVKTTTMSFTPGILLGLSSVSLKGGTNASASFVARNEPVFSWGGFFVLGFNSISVGFAVGKDVALKEGGKTGGWIYNDKLWTGITVGLDVIK